MGMLVGGYVYLLVSKSISTSTDMPDIVCLCLVLKCLYIYLAMAVGICWSEWQGVEELPCGTAFASA